MKSTMNIISSILACKCPRCRSSKLYKAPFTFSNPLNMHEECSVCNQAFEPEPGFYYGAMFVSYGLSSLLLLVPSLILVLGFGWSPPKAILIACLLMAVSFFGILRLSRSAWIHIIVRYEKHLDKLAKKP